MRTCGWVLLVGGLGAACGGNTTASADLGLPCIPVLEHDPSFAGFDEQAVTVDLGSVACGGAVCLVNHFRGRVTCPYGQDATGAAPSGAAPCTVPGTSTPVTPAGQVAGERVQAQCVDRSPAVAVYCSCRCANIAGKTDDGEVYCACPNGFTCAQLVSTLGMPDDGSGGYCMKSGTAYETSSSCGSTCDPTLEPCP